MILQGTLLEQYLLELLLSAVLAFNITAYKLLWDKIKTLEDETDKNAESIDIILKRIFGLEQDPTDEGYIMETENRFSRIAEILEEISEKQDKHMRERKEEHEHVDSKITSIIQVLAEEEQLDVDEEDFKAK